MLPTSAHTLGRASAECVNGPFLQVLDAPLLQDDFYLNLVDWSSQNILAVGLGSSVYLWSAFTSKVLGACRSLFSSWLCVCPVLSGDMTRHQTQHSPYTLNSSTAKLSRATCMCSCHYMAKAMCCNAPYLTA